VSRQLRGRADRPLVPRGATCLLRQRELELALGGYTSHFVLLRVLFGATNPAQPTVGICARRAPHPRRAEERRLLLGQTRVYSPARGAHGPKRVASGGRTTRALADPVGFEIQAARPASGARTHVSTAMSGSM
jgi:hypothetical protein